RRHALEAQDARPRPLPARRHVLGEADEGQELLLERRGRYVGAAAVDPDESAFGDKLVDRLPDRDAADVELIAELPLGGELGLWPPLVRVDAIVDRRLQLGIERQRPAPVEHRLHASMVMTKATLRRTARSRPNPLGGPPTGKKIRSSGEPEARVPA